MDNIKDAYLANVPKEKQMKCNMCNGELNHFDYNETYIWICQECANIQFEYIDFSDISKLKNFLRMMDLDNQRNMLYNITNEMITADNKDWRIMCEIENELEDLGIDRLYSSGEEK